MVSTVLLLITAVPAVLCAVYRLTRLSKMFLRNISDVVFFVFSSYVEVLMFYVFYRLFLCNILNSDLLILDYMLIYSDHWSDQQFLFAITLLESLDFVKGHQLS